MLAKRASPGPSSHAKAPLVPGRREVGPALPPQDAASASRLQTELAELLGEAIEALEHSDASLTFLQQSLGVRSSPRLEQIRVTKLKVRDFLRTHCRTEAPPPAAETTNDAEAK